MPNARTDDGGATQYWAATTTSAPRSVVRVAQVHRLSAVDRAIRDLDLVSGYVVALACLRDPSTSRPWREPTLDPIRRAELDYLARQERADLDEDAPGEHQDAARTDVLDVLDGILSEAVELEQHVSRAAWAPIIRPGGKDPRPHLARTIAYLPTAVTAWTNGDEIAWWAADVASELLTQVSHALSLLTDGQRLKVLCPWCDGRTEMAPTGGQRTWRVRTMPVDLLAIVCEGICAPPPGMSSWWRGAPAWPWYEWEWLARQLDARDAKATIQSGSTK